MSKSAEIHKRNPPYCHPLAQELPPSKAAHFLARTWSEPERSQRIIVDAGCGEGRDTTFLLEKGFRVVALDASQRNLETVTKTGGCQDTARDVPLLRR